MCRTMGPTSDEERVERVRRWADKGKAWAQSMLGDRYAGGIGVDQSYQQAKELFELAASQGKSTSHVHMQMVKVWIKVMREQQNIMRQHSKAG